MTVVMRLRQIGILRLGTMKSGFRYRYARGGKASRHQADRIRRLKIPPAWREVAIDRSPNARIQAVGQDSAGRWQYLYHERAVARREKLKFRRLLLFTRALPRLRQRVSHDLAQRGIGRDRVLACILRILATCFLRPGSEKYASENGSYGIATLRPKHVQTRGGCVRFRFNGKSGKEHDYELNDRMVARVVRTLLAAGGRRVFKFRDENGELKEVRRRHINAYIKEVMGDAFSAKDFRTWAGTVICACALARVGFQADDSAPQVRKKIVAAVKETARTLGNTPAVCRSSYISPCVTRAYEKGCVVEQPLGSAAELATYRGAQLHKCERALLRLLEEFGGTQDRSRRKSRVAARLAA
jgi:DNA topoisomerase-1